MTNLSIISKLDAHVAAGKLFRYSPSVPSVPIGQRWLWLTRGAEEWRKNPGPDYYEEACAIAVVQMNAFVNGEYMDEETDLKLLNPHGSNVWELKACLQPVERHIRMFGWFPCDKHFVFVHAKPRDWLGNNKERWDKSIKKVVEVRRELLAGEAVYCARGINDHL